MEAIKGFKGIKQRVSGNARIQATVARVIRRRISAGRLDRLMDELTEREEMQFIAAMAPYLFTRPAPQKDMLDKLSDEQVDQIIDRIKSVAS